MIYWKLFNILKTHINVYSTKILYDLWKIIQYSQNTHKCILYFLKWIVSLIMNLISETYYSYERR